MGRLINANKNYSITLTKIEAHMSQMVCATSKTNFLSDNQLKMLQRALTANTHKKYVWVKVVDEA